MGKLFNQLNMHHVTFFAIYGTPLSTSAHFP